jgi:membrane-associated phospholipid phosphatase
MTRIPSSSRLRIIAVSAVLMAAGPPSAAFGQNPRLPRDASPPEHVPQAGLYPELRKGREILLASAGAGLMISGLFVPVSTREVPFAGLDPSEVSWGPDRSVVGNRSLDSKRFSNWTLGGAMVFPVALALASAQPGERWRDLGAHGVVYAETLLFSQGSTLLAKTTGSRPRPYAYLAEDQRPDNPSYDVSTERTFRSMPSGHSSSAWTGATLGITEHLLRRPDASWVERVAVGFVGAGLAGATSTLRVTAGQHFRSDVLAGAGIGIVTGVGMPLLHRGTRPLPSAKAWLESMSGVLAGTVVGVLLAR